MRERINKSGKVTRDWLAAIGGIATAVFFAERPIWYVAAGVALALALAWWLVWTIREAIPHRASPVREISKAALGRARQRPHEAARMARADLKNMPRLAFTRDEEEAMYELTHEHGYSDAAARLAIANACDDGATSFDDLVGLALRELQHRRSTPPRPPDPLRPASRLA
jgi:hypothetical protein